MSHNATARDQWTDLQSVFLESRAGRGPFDIDAGTLVVLPSLTLQYDELRHVVGIQFYEERLLFLLLLLARPDVRIIYLTSVTIEPEIIDYYLRYTPEPDDARSRLTLVPVGDLRQQSLTSRVVESAAVMATLHDALNGVDEAYLLPFNVTPAEEELAARLGIAMYGPAAELAELGDKSHGRRLARAAGVPIVDGYEDLRTFADLATAFATLPTPTGQRVAVAKLNDSFSGMGNVVLSDQPRDDGIRIVDTAIWAVLPEPGDRWDDYLRRLGERGGVLERLVPQPIAAPSVQILCAPGVGPQVVSTHDQILGGTEDQVYIGCSFPADERYRASITALALAIADGLFERGVVGLFGVDFLVHATPDGDSFYFGEINLRLGGTTHPFGICRYLTEGTYDQASGELMTATGSVSYLASDNVQYDALIGRSPASVLDELAAHELLFEPKTKRGITLHQLGSIRTSGKVGVVSIAGSASEARELFGEAMTVMRS